MQRRVLGRLAGHLEQNASWLSSGVQPDPRSQSKSETVKRTVRKQSRVASSGPLRAQIEQKQRKGEIALLLELRDTSSPALRHWFLSSQAFRLD